MCSLLFFANYQNLLISYYRLSSSLESIIQAMSVSQRPKTRTQLYEMKLRDEVYQEVFTRHLNINYKIQEIPITEFQTIHTVFLPCTDKDKAQVENYYVGHGFGGTSVMYFYLIHDLLKKGNVILWEIRGMGFSMKLSKYDLCQIENIQSFFLDGIGEILKFYNHSNACIIGHSFSSYLVLLFTLKRQDLTKKHIKQILLLSPVGITIKQEDYKYKSTTCLSLFQDLFHKCVWCVNSNFKSPFKWICCLCFKDYILEKMIIDEIQLDEKQAKVMLIIVRNFIELSNGSENLFFELFEPKILPKIPIQPLIVKEPPINITIVYGDEKDWVDKTGATKLSQRFPNQIRKLQIENVTHNIAFHAKACRELFDFILK